MAERPEEYELPDIPRSPIDDESNEEYIRLHHPSISEIDEYNNYRLDRESFENFKKRQKLIESNRVNPRSSFLDGRHTETKILKGDILKKILDLPYDDKDVDSVFKDIKIEPVDNYTYRVYYKGDEIVKYNSRLKFYDVSSQYYLNNFRSMYNEKYVRQEMRTDFSVRSDLSTIDLEVRQSESEEYHERIDSLEREISRLKQVEDDSIEKDRRIRDLENELKKEKIDADSKIDSLRDKIRIESTQLVESQNNIRDLEVKISDLEFNIGLKNIDNTSLQRQLDNSRESLASEKKRHEQYLSDLKFDTNREKESLESDLESRKIEIKNLVEQRDKSDKKVEELLDFQNSLQIKVLELESSLNSFETNLDVEKTISESKEKELDIARNKIKILEENIVDIEKNKNSEIAENEAKVIFLENINKISKKDIKSKELELENTKRDYEDKIRDNETEIGNLRFERENLNNRVSELNREIERSDNVNEVLTTQLDLANTEVINLNGRIQEIQNQNQTLITELDSLISNFNSLVTSSETTNHNNTLEIQKLNIKIKELEDNDDIKERVNELLESVDTYKGLLDDEYENKKKLKKDFEEEFNRLNKEKEDLVKDLKSKSKNEKDLMKKLLQNENSYSLLTKKYEDSFSKIYDLTVELDKTSEREKILQGELEYRESRIKAKDEEITEKMVEIEKLKKQIEENNFNIKNSDFYEQQYKQASIKLDKTTSERNMYIQELNNSKKENEELEDEIQVLEKEIEVLKKDRDLILLKTIPKEKVDQMRHDNQELNKQLDVKEKQVKELVEKHRISKSEYDMAMNNFNKLKKKVDRKLDLIKKSYEKELEVSRKKLAKTISPGELKALNVFLEDLDIEDYDKVDYDTQIKKLRSAREKFKRLIDDPSTDRAHRLQYKYLDDLMQYRIDFLNIEFKKPIETIKGRDYLIRIDSSWSPLGILKKILLAAKSHPGTTMSLVLTLVSNAAFGIFYLVSTSASYSKKSVVNVTRKIVRVVRPIRPITKVEPQKTKPSQTKPSQKVEPQKTKPSQTKPSQKVEPQKTKPSQTKPSKKVEPDKSKDVIAGGSILYNIISNIPSYTLNFAEKLINFIDWSVQNFYKLIISGIIASITLYNMYGEQMSFPILAFWSFVLANAIVFATTLVGILPSWIVG